MNTTLLLTAPFLGVAVGARRLLPGNPRRQDHTDGGTALLTSADDALVDAGEIAERPPIGRDHGAADRHTARGDLQTQVESRPRWKGRAARLMTRSG